MNTLEQKERAIANLGDLRDSLAHYKCSLLLLEAIALEQMEVEKMGRCKDCSNALISASLEAFFEYGGLSVKPALDILNLMEQSRYHQNNLRCLIHTEKGTR